MKPLCIYHASCDDGFAAAWSVRAALGNEVEFLAAHYQNPPPDVTGREVIIVDFSYKRAVLLEMAAVARNILILDHHKTAREDLEDYKWEEHVEVHFDMSRSGAGLTWDHFHSLTPRPAFIDYIEDRDLWLKRLPGVDEFTAALRSYPMDFAVWDGLVAAGPDALIAEGKSIQRYYRGRVEAMKQGAYQANIGGEPCWIVNCSGFMASEVAGELSQRGLNMGAIYFEVAPGEWVYSLRSSNDFDVSAVAKQFGGGGHKGAAGFKAAKLIHEAA